MHQPLQRLRHAAHSKARIQCATELTQEDSSTPISKSIEIERQTSLAGASDGVPDQDSDASIIPQRAILSCQQIVHRMTVKDGTNGGAKAVVRSFCRK